MTAKTSIIETSDLIGYIKKKGGTVDSYGTMHLPKTIGTGYLKRIKPVSELTLMLQHYELSKPLKIIRGTNKNTTNALIFSFRNVLSKSAGFEKQADRKSFFKRLPSVQVSTTNIVLDIDVPAHFQTSNIIIGVDIKFLEQLIQNDHKPNLIEWITGNKQAYLYEEIMSPKIQAAAAEIFQAGPDDTLINYFYRLKAEELIYLFLNNLLKRPEAPPYPINQNDLKIIYTIRDELNSEIGTPPQLESLAGKAGMSVSKLVNLFRQVFGDSIYNYYQKLRMQEAAYLLREEKLSVSEVGFQLGFSNLSHFSRLFEKHIGMKPKQYSKSL